MTRRGLQRWQSALTSRRSWKQSCIRLTRAGKSCDRLIEINLTNNSEESLVRAPRLGKNSADFSEQVAHATAKCKVWQVLYFLLQFWLCCRIYYLYTLPIRACSSSQVGGSFLLASIRKKTRRMRSRSNVMNWPKSIYWLGKISRLRMLGGTQLTRASWRSMWRVLLPRPSCTGVQGWMINNVTLPTKGWAKANLTFKDIYSLFSLLHCGTSAHPFDTQVTGLLFPSNYIMWYKDKTDFQILYFLEGVHSAVQICVIHGFENCRPHHGKRDCGKVKRPHPRRKSISCFSPSTPGMYHNWLMTNSWYFQARY